MRIIDSPALLEKHIASCYLQKHFSSPLAGSSVLVSVQPREMLISRGAISRYLFFLVSGRVRFVSDGPSDHRINYGYARIGDPIGEVGSLWNRPPQVSVQAVTESLFVAIDLQAHREELLDDNTFLRYICGKLIDSVTGLNKSILTLCQAPASSRIAACILRNAPEETLSLSLMECAQQTGVSYRHLIRVVNRFCKAGFISKQGKKYTITNRRHLEVIADHYAVPDPGIKHF